MVALTHGRIVTGLPRPAPPHSPFVPQAANYSIKFEKCATSNDYYGGYFGGNNNNQNNNGNAAGYNGMYEQRLVHFKLCPSDTCGSDCSNGADYVVDMSEFVEAYLEEKAEAQEKACETAKQSCEYNCQNANDDEVSLTWNCCHLHLFVVCNISRAESLLYAHLCSCARPNV